MTTETATQTPAPLHPLLRKLSSNRASMLKMGLYGKSGVGKTYLAAGIAKHKKTLLIFSEKSDTTFKFHPDAAAIDENLFIIDVEGWEEIRKAVEFAVNHQREFDWIIIDSLTDINKRIIEDISEAGKDEILPQKGEMLSMRQWGQVGARMERIIRLIRDIKTNVLFVCLASTEKNDATGEVCMYPSLTGRLKEEMPAYLDVNGYIYTVESKDQPGIIQRAVQFVNSPRAIAKDRSGRLSYEYADITAILGKLNAL